MDAQSEILKNKRNETYRMIEGVFFETEGTDR